MKLRNTVLFTHVILMSVALTACQTATPTYSVPAPPAMSASKEMKLKERAKVLAEKMQQNPCYVQIWEDENYQDDTDVLVGPMDSADMKSLPGANINDWSDEIDSLKVGPKATVTVWQDPNYNEAVQTYTSNTEKTNLRGTPNFSDEISSMKITCEK